MICEFGLPQGGRELVARGLLAATIIVPINAGAGLEMMVKALRNGTTTPEITFTVPASYPAIESLEKTALK